MSRVLLIEDNEVNQELIARFLQLYGHQVTVAGDGMTGLRHAQETVSQFDVILLDMNLPDLDGWEVAQRMKADARSAPLPIIAVTAHAMVGDREKVLAAGCDDYTTKPIDFNVLLSKIDQITQAVLA
ncbi:response regulator [Anatilimnocola floriformis]|uniref:response regulator n=1 Tax=Anatilimnocola floriformis TaxID=2948575 RepID=UPI0020C4582B|nr:response regulator [Anatilimnocola floriformis]